MIVNWFSLALAIGIEPPPAGGGGGGGGPYPGPAWNVMPPGGVANFYKPYSPDQQMELVNLKQKTKLFYIRIKLGERQVEKMYEVTERRADMIARVINVADKARSKFNVTITNLRRMAPSISDFRKVASKLVVSVKSIRRKK
jgi:hypothetical protein